MIKATGLNGDFIKDLDFEIKRGESAFLVIEDAHAREEFLHILLGFKSPVRGELSVSGVNITSLKSDELLQYRKRTGIVFNEGGLISNLRLWENLVLPALYHRIDSPKKIKEKGLKLLDELGIKKEPLTRVSDLTAFEKTLTGLGRALLMEPDIIILWSALQGLTNQEKESLIDKLVRLKKDTTLLCILISQEESSLLSGRGVKFIGVSSGGRDQRE